MTKKIYFYSDKLEYESEVISCIESEDNQYGVILSSTIFHPRGGGQPTDKGFLDYELIKN